MRLYRVSSEISRKLGYTTVELLVVIAIVLVLVALIFPVSQKLIHKSHLVKCIGNLHSMGIALGSYAAENQGEWPFAIDDRASVDPALRGTWYTATAYDSTNKRLDGVGRLFPYIRDKRIFVCPEHANGAAAKAVALDGNYASDPPPLRNSYAARGFNQSNYPSRPDLRKLVNIDRRSIAACNFAYAPSNPINFPLTRHDGNYPVLFSDGSVEVKRFPEGAVNTNNPPDINGNTTRQIRVWDYFDGKLENLKL